MPCFERFPRNFLEGKEKGKKKEERKKSRFQNSSSLLARHLYLMKYNFQNSYRTHRMRFSRLNRITKSSLHGVAIFIYHAAR